jgi:rubredoxin
MSSVYDIYHTPDYNPNTRELVLFEADINKAHVPEILQRLSKRYYLQMAQKEATTTKASIGQNLSKGNVLVTTVHQCKSCLTRYDERFGDEVNNIPAGIPFNELPTSYTCPVCEGAISDFTPINLSMTVSV